MTPAALTALAVLTTVPLRTAQLTGINALAN
jgi:hypothetical protein